VGLVQMGVIVDGLPALLGRGRDRWVAVEMLSADIDLNLQTIRTSRFGSGEPLRQLNPTRFGHALATDTRHRLWRAAVLADASVVELEQRSTGTKRTEVRITDQAVRRMATSAQVLHKYLIERGVWLRAVQIDVAAVVGLSLIVASLTARAGRWPSDLEMALPAFMLVSVAVVLITDAVAWSGKKLAYRALSSLYKPFCPYPSIDEAQLSGADG